MALNYSPTLQRMAKGYVSNNLVDTKLSPLQKADNVTGQVADYGMQLLEVVSAAKSLYGTTATIDGDPTVSDSYSLERFRVKKLVSGRRVDSANDPVKPLSDGVRHCLAVVGNSREYALATYCNDDSNFTNSTTLSGTSQYGSTADDPTGTINTAVRSARSGAGVTKKDVSLWMSTEVLDVLEFDDDILDLGKKYVGPIAATTPDVLAKIFGIKEVIECTSQYKSSAKGQTATKARMFGKHLWAGVLGTPGESFGMPFAFTMHMNELLKVEQEYDMDTECYKIYVADHFDQWICAEGSVCMIKDAVA